MLTGEDGLRLVFGDQHLEEDQKTLSFYGIQHMSTILLVVKVAGGLIAWHAHPAAAADAAAAAIPDQLLFLQ